MINRFFFSLLLSLLGGSTAISSELDPLSKLSSYYNDLHVCSAATVESVNRSGGGLTVKLNVESKTASAIQQLDQENQNNWMALHCPPEFPYFRKAESIVDVRIQAQSENNPLATLSCAQFYGNKHIQTKGKLANKLNQLKYRLSKLTN